MRRVGSCWPLPGGQSVLVAEAARPTVRVVKRKWDGTISAVDNAHRLTYLGDCAAWLVSAGSHRERPGSGAIELIGSDELWVAVPGEWWVLCGFDAGSSRLQDSRLASVRDTAVTTITCGRPRPTWRSQARRWRLRTRRSSTTMPARWDTPRRSCGVPGRASPRSRLGTRTATGRSTGRWRVGWPPSRLRVRARADSNDMDRRAAQVSRASR